MCTHGHPQRLTGIVHLATLPVPWGQKWGSHLSWVEQHRRYLNAGSWYMTRTSCCLPGGRFPLQRWQSWGISSNCDGCRWMVRRRTFTSSLSSADPVFFILRYFLSRLLMSWRIPGVVHGWLALVLAVLCGMSFWIADSRGSMIFFHSPSVVSWSHLSGRSALRSVAAALRPSQFALAYKGVVPASFPKNWCWSHNIVCSGRRGLVRLQLEGPGLENLSGASPVYLHLWLGPQQVVPDNCHLACWGSQSAVGGRMALVSALLWSSPSLGSWSHLQWVWASSVCG